jgi:hypothetical protein
MVRIVQSSGRMPPGYTYEYTIAALYRLFPPGGANHRDQVCAALPRLCLLSEFNLYISEESV